MIELKSNRVCSVPICSWAGLNWACYYFNCHGKKKNIFFQKCSKQAQNRV